MKLRKLDFASSSRQKKKQANGIRAYKIMRAVKDSKLYAFEDFQSLALQTMKAAGLHLLEPSSSSHKGVPIGG